MRVRFRTYCQGCRYGRRWQSIGGRCLWPAHRWDWEWIILCDGHRLQQRQGFHTFERARASAERAWHKLAAVSCIRTAA
jgi:hypothetical protein